MLFQAVRPVNVSDYREIAKRKLPRGLFEFIDRGSEDEVALANNRQAFDHIKLAPRVFVDVSQRSQTIELFGETQQMPLVIAPTGAAGLLHYRGEIALAKAATAAGIPLALSIGSITAMEDLVRCGGQRWFQIYIWPDREQTFRLVERAKAAGFLGLVVTVDAPVAANREYNIHNDFTVPFRFSATNVIDMALAPRWLLSVIGRYMITGGIPQHENFPPELKHAIAAMADRQVRTPLSDSLTWNDLRSLRDQWPGKLIVKGVLNATDAALAVDHGADAVIVSNHGGRNLDSAMAPIDVLPQIAAAIGTRGTVLIDSGFRRGSDVVKALALGAKAVLIGRPTLYGVTVGGEAGATDVLGIFRKEIDRMLAFLGCKSVAELGPEHVQFINRVSTR
jgi:isopentenyl diphosphate isomerase/L-lactate dehydrogenase-like FMN-dependent dehydrogenase